MLAVERRFKVLERIAADQAVEVSSLAREFGVSEMTIRRDLRRLDRDGFVRRTYGGATTRVVRSAGGFEATQNARTLHHAQEKRQIALRAADLTADARVMFIGVGSTVEQFARPSSTACGYGRYTSCQSWTRSVTGSRTSACSSSPSPSSSRACSAPGRSG